MTKKKRRRREKRLVKVDAGRRSDASRILRSLDFLHKVGDIFILNIPLDIPPENIQDLVNFIEETDIKILTIRTSSVSTLKILLASVSRSRISELNLSRNNIGYRLTKRICRMVPQTLSDLDLSHNRIDERECELIARGLVSCKQLKTLNLNHNCICYGIYEIVHALKINKTLRTLTLSNCGIDMDGANFIGDGLPLISLIELDLSHNDLDSIRDGYDQDILSEGSCGIRSLAEGLKYNKTLRRLSLDQTLTMREYNMGDEYRYEYDILKEATELLDDTLGYNLSLQILVLSHRHRVSRHFNLVEGSETRRQFLGRREYFAMKCIQRFWRLVSSNPIYKYARRTIEAVCNT